MEAAKFLRATVPSTIEIRTDVRSDAAVWADPSEIHRVIMNLCTNAVLAMREDGGTLDVGLTGESVDEAAAVRLGVVPGEFVRLRVRDDGSGMDPRVREHIFEPFFTTRPKGSGTGMGLAVVHGIVHSLRGAIEIDSTLGAGTTFDIHMPVAKQGAPAAAKFARRIRPGTGRVLVVDDDQLVLDSVTAMLRELGYQARPETSSAAALATFEADPLGFDLVLTDMTMPGMNGDVLVGRLVHIRPDLPIVLTSGYAEGREHGCPVRHPAVTYLAKPIYLETLSEVVRKVLGGTHGEAKIGVEGLAHE
jgi:CheY-like chemotaxis protein/anti-sigma regulatory factor (Ser/Thr protein kinase)